MYFLKIVVRLVIAKTRYSGHNAKLGQVFPVRHPGDERGANSPTEDAWCTAHTRVRARSTKFSVSCDFAEMNMFRRRTPARVALPAAVTCQEKRFFSLFQLVTRYMTR
jgi:hypothetical protein